MFSPFLLLSFLIIGPYMIDDHLPTLCTMTSYTSRQDGYYSNFYTIVNVNYTVGQGSMLSGVYKTCYSSSPGVRDACVTTLPPSFQCFVEKSYDGSSAPSTNDVLKIDEYFGQKNILVRNIGIGYGSLVFFILSCVSIYLSAEWILDNLVLKITESDLGNGSIDKTKYNLKMTPTLSNDEIYYSSLLFDKIVFDYLAHTAKVNEESIEWCEHPSTLKLLFSHGWSVGIFSLLGLLPLVFLMIIAVVYSLFYYDFTDWALPVIEFAMGYILLIYIFYIFAFVMAARGTRYYITSKRGISIIELFGTIWVNQISFDEVGYVDTANNKNTGSIFVRSKHYLVVTKLFSYISDIEYVISLIKNKLTVPLEDQESLEEGNSKIKKRDGIEEVIEQEFPTPFRGETQFQIGNEVELKDL